MKKQSIFSFRLKKLRKDNKVTQEDLAKAIGISRTNIPRWENEQLEPSIEMLTKIARYFRVTVDYLVGTDIDTLIDFHDIEEEAFEEYKDNYASSEGEEDKFGLFDINREEQPEEYKTAYRQFCDNIEIEEYELFEIYNKDPLYIDEIKKPSK